MIKTNLCPVCKSDGLIPILSCRDHTVSHETFSIVECQTCSLRITNPRPNDSELHKYYESDNYISHKKQATSFLDYVYKSTRVITLNSKFALVKSWSASKPKVILDYGCGSGAFLQKCKAGGLTVMGVEPSTTARKIATEATGLDVKETLNQITEPADLITLWHVLEHIPDLHATLSDLHALLKENGTMFIAVPNHQSYDANKYREHWAGYDVPRHLWHFGKKSMTLLLTQHNFSLTAILPMKLDAYYVSILSEKYKGSNFLSSLIKGFLAGLTSNMKAAESNYSSLIYVFRKK